MSDEAASSRTGPAGSSGRRNPPDWLTGPPRSRPEAGRVHDEASLSRFFSELEATLHDLSVRTALCWWDKYTGGRGEGLDELEEEWSALACEPAYRSLVRAWLGRARDRLLARKLELLRQLLAVAGVDSAPEVRTLRKEITDQVVSFRPTVFGRQVSSAEPPRILRREPDRSLRREAWVSTVPLSTEVGPATAELLQRRNRLAREAGYAGYADLVLGVASLSQAEVLLIVDGVEKATAGPYAALLHREAKAEGLDAVEPWDIDYLAERATALPAEPFPREKVVPALEELVRSFDLDPAALGIRIVVHDVPDGGVCLALDPPADVRVLADPQDGLDCFQTLFHEYGHGLHAAFAGDNPQLLKQEPAVFAEGMAEVWSGFTFYPRWLERLGLGRRLVETVVRSRAARLVFRHRRLAAEVAWELTAYGDPGLDLGVAAAAAEERYLLCAARSVHRWAGRPLPADTPVHRQDGILADLIAAATHRRLEEDYGENVLGNRDVFERLATTYWRPGAVKPWREKLREFTGRDLDPSAVDYYRSSEGARQA